MHFPEKVGMGPPPSWGFGAQQASSFASNPQGAHLNLGPPNLAKENTDTTSQIRISISNIFPYLKSGCSSGGLETGSSCVAQAGLKLKTPLALPPQLP